MSGGPAYKFVIPATPENIEVRLGCMGLDVNKRIFMDAPARARLNLFTRYGFLLIVQELEDDKLRIRIACPFKGGPKLKLSE